MALVTSVCMVMHCVLIPEGMGMDDFFESFHATLSPVILVPKNMSMLTVCPKCPEIDVRLVGYNYLDVDAFHAAFESFQWDEVPTLLIREHESDLMRVMPGTLTLGPPPSPEVVDAPHD